MTNIQLSSPRQTVKVTLPDGQVYSGAVGTSVEAFLQAANCQKQGHFVAALVDGKLRELSHQLHQDAQLKPLFMSDSDGVRIYRRSLSFLMIVAAAECFPDKTAVIQHSVPSGGYYCELSDKGDPTHAPLLNDAELNRLDQKMRELVEADLPIRQIKRSLQEALQLFQESGDAEKAELFAKRRKSYLTLYELNGVQDYFHGFMVPSTGYLNLFSLSCYENGFVLKFPRRYAPTVLQPFMDEQRLAKVFRDYTRWLDVIEVPSVPALNRAITQGRTLEVILIAEALHAQQLTHIAQEIANRRPDCRLVLISGPTSAGKTTFTKRLAVQLLAQGIHPLAISMDNYFVERDQTPLDEKGEYDFEAFEALDVPLFQVHLRQLLAGETITPPIFNFLTGKREWDAPLKMRANQVILIEGIHGLNPQLVEGIAPSSMYRIFLSAFTQLNLDRHNRVPTTDTRLLRRIIRDAAHRGYTATDTIQRWQSVRRGERMRIFPHQKLADVFFNSALVYELAVLKKLAEPLLLQVDPTTPERIESQRLMAFLQWFEPIAVNNIPNSSILREFVGGSIFANFEPWQS